MHHCDRDNRLPPDIVDDNDYYEDKDNNPSSHFLKMDMESVDVADVLDQVPLVAVRKTTAADDLAESSSFLQYSLE